ncbi:MAG: hypothetical protein UV41_C0031G0001, partial [Candidatus Daviesbacteria bacterium GW2011_GWA2_42_7]
LFFPPLIGNSSDFDPTLIGSLISLGIILMTPNVVTMLKAALKAPKMDTGLGKAIGAGPKAVQGAFGTAMQGLSMKYQWGMIKQMGERKPAPPVVPGPTPAGGSH